MSAADILNAYNPQLLRPGENEATFQFTGPGVVVLVREEPDRVTSTILEVFAADHALSVAHSLLKQPRPDDLYRYAMLLSIPDRARRESVATRLAEHCERG